MNNTIKKKEGTIIELEQSVKKIENKLDDHKQYRRRNSIRISGIKESENEGIGERVLNLFNNRIKLKPPVTAEQIDRVHRTVLRVPLPPICACATMSGTAGICHSYF